MGESERHYGEQNKLDIKKNHLLYDFTCGTWKSWTHVSGD